MRSYTFYFRRKKRRRNSRRRTHLYLYSDGARSFTPLLCVSFSLSHESEIRGKRIILLYDPPNDYYYYYYWISRIYGPVEPRASNPINGGNILLTRAIVTTLLIGYSFPLSRALAQDTPPCSEVNHLPGPKVPSRATYCLPIDFQTRRFAIQKNTRVRHRAGESAPSSGVRRTRF